MLFLISSFVVMQTSSNLCSVLFCIIFSRTSHIKHLSNGGSSQTTIGNCSLNACQQWQFDEEDGKTEQEETVGTKVTFVCGWISVSP